jgi:hypothetical protein
MHKSRELIIKGCNGVRVKVGNIVWNERLSTKEIKKSID